MVSNQVGALLVGLGPPAAWLVAYTSVLVATRQRPIRPAPPTPDLGPEPPALVNLLVHQNEVTEDAAEATLLDLAARRVIELRAPDDDPAHTTVHLRQVDPPGLVPYEQRVLRRVEAVAAAGVAPLTALTFSDADQADRWMDGLRDEVRHDARVRGMAASNFSGTAGFLLVFFACLGIPSGFGFGAALWGLPPDAVDADAWMMPRALAGGVAGFLVFIGLALVTVRSARLRLSRLGRQRTAHWLGVRDWLTAYPTFADLPPAAAAVWDRYLAYGAALGTTVAASRTIRLGLGGRRSPWSYTAGGPAGGRWRRVRVRPLVFRRLRRLVPPLAAPVRLTGSVLWVDRRRHLIAIDDGGRDETRPWLVPDRLVGDVFGGDVVSVTARPWRRQITSLTATSRGAEWQGGFRSAAPRTAGLRPMPMAEVLSTAELGELLRLPLRVVGDDRAVVDYVSPVDGRKLLRMERLDRIGDLDRWNERPAGYVLEGVGDEAYFGTGWAVARLGEDFLLVRSWPPVDPRVPADVVRTALPRLAG